MGSDISANYAMVWENGQQKVVNDISMILNFVRTQLEQIVYCSRALL